MDNGDANETRGAKDDDEMQVVRVDELREWLHAQPDEEARTPRGRDAVRVVRIDIVWERMHAQSDEETPPRAGESMHLVRVDVHGERVHAQSDGKAREVGGAAAPEFRGKFSGGGGSFP